MVMKRSFNTEEELDSDVFLKSVLIAFILLIILVLAQIGYAINQLDVLQEKMERDTSFEFEKIRLLSEAESLSVRRSALLIKMTLSQDETERQNLYSEYQQYENFASNSMEQLQKLETNPENQQLITNQLINMKRIKVAREAVINLLQNGDLATAQTLLQSNVLQQQNSIRQLFVTLREHQQAQARKMLAKANSEYVSAKNVILWTGLFVVIVVIMISFAVLRRAKKHVNSIESRLVSLEASRLRLHKKATRDALTGLANKSQLNGYLQQKLKKTSRRKSFALMYLDLDGFKSINDEFGHAVGDRLLTLAAQRMQGMLREYDFIARVGGDEFVIIMQETEDSEGCILVAKKLIAFLSEPFSIGSVICRIGVSVGIAFYPEHGKDGAQLVHNADNAMYLAKKNGKNQFAIFKPSDLDQENPIVGKEKLRKDVI